MSDRAAVWLLARVTSLLEQASPLLSGQARYTIDAARANIETVLEEEFDA